MCIRDSVEGNDSGKVGIGRTLIDYNGFSGYMTELEIRVDFHSIFILKKGKTCLLYTSQMCL